MEQEKEMTERELINLVLMPTMQTLVKEVRRTTETIKLLEEKQKKLEKERKYYSLFKDLSPFLEAVTCIILVLFVEKFFF